MTDPYNFAGFILLFGVLFGMLTGISFRLLRLRLVESKGRIFIVGPGDKVEEGRKPQDHAGT